MRCYNTELEVLRPPQSSRISGTSSSDCLELYPLNNLMMRVLPLKRNAVGVFYSLSRLGHRTLVGGVLPFCRDAVGVFYSLSRLGYRTLVGGVLPFCRDAVGVFYSLSRLGHKTPIGGVLPLCRDTVGVFYKPLLGRLDHNNPKKQL